MHDRRVYLAGDAAHLITPAGGKGMNLAIQDALELGQGLRERYGEGSQERLARYTNTRLPAIWRMHEFSNWMLALLHAGLGRSGAVPTGSPSESSDFSYRLRRARLQELIDNPDLSSWFAHAYAGVDP
jgi:p-hydroxybenzoate 3-monooxygenase